MNKQPISIFTLCIMLIVFSACSTSAPRSTQWAVATVAPCQRISVGWPVDFDVLREIVGQHFLPARQHPDGKGTLLLILLKCSNSKIGDTSTGPLTLAQVQIPLDSGHTPWIISGLSDNAWKSVALTAGPRGSAVLGLFRRHGYTVLEGASFLDINDEPTGVTVEGSVRFAEGSISLRAQFNDPPEPFQRVDAFVGTGLDYFAVHSGPQTMLRRSNGLVNVYFSGNTPLSDLGLAEKPLIAVLDTELVWALNIWSSAFDQNKSEFP